jgi:hypothetical protein
MDAQPEESAMKSRIAVAALVAVLVLSVPGCAATYDGGYDRPRSSNVSTSVGFFYDALAPYGTWVEAGTYGWAWCPLDAPLGWRPYTVGYWAYSDWGWMWVAEDPWGWIPYHYGRWGFDSQYGWIWVPGDVWAPAWVAWRYGDDWVGWAPLPPDVGWNASLGISFTSYDLDRRIDRFSWCFVRDRDFGRARRLSDIAPAGRNVTLLRQTRNVTRYVASRDIPVERGLRPELIERATGRSIPRFRVEESHTPIRGGGAVVRGRTLRVYRPDGRVAQELRERLRQVPPPERRVAPRRLIERQEAERRQQDRHWADRRKQLDQQHQRELRQPPRGVTRTDLRRRQEAEVRAQHEMEQRQRQMFEARERRLGGSQNRREENQGRGRGRGRDGS